MHDILFISRIFPPYGGSAVQGPTKLAKYLPSFGVVPHVVTGPLTVPLVDDSLLSEIPHSVPVSRVFTFEPEVLGLYINKKWKSNAFIRLFFKFILKCYSVVYYRVAFPDLFFGWVPFGFIKCMSLVRKNKLELIYVNGQPPCCILIGHWIKKIFRIPLVIDYIDPWMATPGYYPGKGFAGRLNRVLERKFLNAADLVVYCKKSIFEDITAAYHIEDTKKYVFIPLGYDPADFSSQSIIRGQKKIKIAYTGKLRKNFCYSPKSFFQALYSLMKEDKINPDILEVVCAGLIAPDYLALIKELDLENIVKHIGYVSHSDSIALIQSADALLLLIESEKGRTVSESFSGSLPSKIFEYLYTGKPILAIIPHGFEYELIQKSNLGFFAEPNDPGSVKNALENLLLFSHRDAERPKPDCEFIRSFNRKNLTEQLAGHLLRLIAQNQTGGFET
jgi:Glycosyltransferase